MVSAYWFHNLESTNRKKFRKFSENKSVLDFKINLRIFKSNQPKILLSKLQIKRFI